MFMVAEIHDDEWCDGVWFSVCQVCYHRICAYVGICTEPEQVWDDLNLYFFRGVDVNIHNFTGSWWYFYVSLQ